MVVLVVSLAQMAVQAAEEVLAVEFLRRQAVQALAVKEIMVALVMPQTVTVVLEAVAALLLLVEVLLVAQVELADMAVMVVHHQLLVLQ
jgi:hypothetical protein